MNAKGHAPPLGRFGYVPREMFVCMPRSERETELLSAVICQRKFENLQQSGQQKQRYRRKKVQPYRHCTPARYGRTEGNRELVRRDWFADENSRPVQTAPAVRASEKRNDRDRKDGGRLRQADLW